MPQRVLRIITINYSQYLSILLCRHIVLVKVGLLERNVSEIMLIVTGIHLQVRVSLLSYMDLNTFLEGEIAIWGINREKAAAIGSRRAHP